MYDTNHDDTLQERQDPFLEQLDQQIKQHITQRAEIHEQIRSLLERLETEDRILASALELHHRITGSRHPQNAEFQEGRRTPLSKKSTGNAVTSDAASPSSGGLIERPATVPNKGRLRDIYDILSASDCPVRLTAVAEQLKESGKLDGVDNPTPAIAAALSRGVGIGLFDRVSRGMYTVRHANEDPS